jgi:predicted ATP-grasp superfamily ATP-dependent carboligase
MNNNQKNISVLIPDGEIPMSLRVVQCLSEIQGVEMYVISSTRNTSARFSRYVKKYFYRKEQENTKAWFDLINDLTNRYAIDVVMPVFETTVRTFIENKHLLQDQDKFLLPETLKHFEKARNKWLLHRQLEELHIPSPRSFDLAGNGLNSFDLSILNFPVIIKPKAEVQGGGKGIVKFNDVHELEAFRKNNSLNSSYILQEYFQGLDLGFNVICKKGEVLAYTIQLGTLFEESEFKPQIGLRMIDEDNVLLAGKKLLKALEWTGVAHIDFLYNPENNEFVVLEINPRYWLTLQASTLSGVNFPWLYCQTVIGEQLDFKGYSKTEYLELRGLWKMLGTKPFYLLNFVLHWKKSPLKYFVKDPIMTIYHLFYSLKVRFGRRE